MGCAASQAVIIHSPPADYPMAQQQQHRADPNNRLQPTIFMVAQENFQMLRELGELKFYHLAQPNDTEEKERIHHDMMSRLENPVRYEREELRCNQTIKAAPSALMQGRRHEKFPQATNSKNDGSHGDNEVASLSPKIRTKVSKPSLLAENTSCSASSSLTTSSPPINTTVTSNKEVVVVNSRDSPLTNDPNQCPQLTIDSSTAVQTSCAFQITPSTTFTSDTTAKNKTFFLRRNRIQPSEQHNDDYSTPSQEMTINRNEGEMT